MLPLNTKIRDSRIEMVIVWTGSVFGFVALYAGNYQTCLKVCFPFFLFYVNPNCILRHQKTLNSQFCEYKLEDCLMFIFRPLVPLKLLCTQIWHAMHWNYCIQSLTIRNCKKKKKKGNNTWNFPECSQE